jgi:hypothetical protein
LNKPILAAGGFLGSPPQLVQRTVCAQETQSGISPLGGVSGIHWRFLPPQRQHGTCGSQRHVAT